MERIYKFSCLAIKSGRTVLIYRGVTAKTAKHVRNVERLSMRDGVMHCNWVSCKGLTICLKP
mgnify:CR=1 FL=1